MATQRQIQVANEIQQIVSVLLQREMKDPRIGFVTVTGADITSDLKYAKVYVSVMGTPEEKRETMEALTRSRGFVRREIAARMSIRAVPEVNFKLDQSIEHSDNVNRILNELKLAEAEKAASESGTEAFPEANVDADATAGEEEQP